MKKRLDKQTAAYSDHIIQLGKLMERATDTCNNMGGSHKHYAKWSKADTHTHKLLCDFMYKKL